MRICRLFSFWVVASLLCADCLSDRLVAIVEKKPITEQELLTRYEIHRKTATGSASFPAYETVRPTLLHELCLEKMNEVLWERLTTQKIQVSEEELKSFKHTYNLEGLMSKHIEDFYAGLMRKEQLTRYLIQDKIELSEYEIDYFSRQPQAWHTIDSRWSFKIAYSPEPLTALTAERVARVLDNYPVDRIARSLLSNIDWKCTNAWQFFQENEEYVGIYLYDIRVPSLLEDQYTIHLLSLPRDAPLSKEEARNFFENQALVPAEGTLRQLDVTLVRDLPSTLLTQLKELEVSAVSEPVLISGRCYCMQLLEKKPWTSSQYQEQILALLKQQLLDKKTEEKLPLWYDSLKKDYFIKVIT